jgi:hypothetical protein
MVTLRQWVTFASAEALRKKAAEKLIAQRRAGAHLTLPSEGQGARTRVGPFQTSVLLQAHAQATAINPAFALLGGTGMKKLLSPQLELFADGACAVRAQAKPRAPDQASLETEIADARQLLRALIILGMKTWLPGDLRAKVHKAERFIRTHIKVLCEIQRWSKSAPERINAARLAQARRFVNPPRFKSSVKRSSHPLVA